MKKLLEKYFYHNIPIEMIYEARNGELTQRAVRIIHIGDTHLIGFCYLRKTKRTFKIENILSCQRLKEKSFTLCNNNFCL
ncbi:MULTISPECIES: hypothetical protein [Bacillus]|uniref:hypothetical protein n=1 Tax=Bacillus TaxID=1386 RepID=UPI001D0D15C6|nr:MULTISPECIES: hypothetical protein [Bacillus]